MQEDGASTQADSSPARKLQRLGTSWQVRAHKASKVHRQSCCSCCCMAHACSNACHVLVRARGWEKQERVARIEREWQQPLCPLCLHAVYR